MINKLRDIYNALETEFDFYCPVNVKIVISNRLRSSNGYFQGKKNRYTKEIISAKIVMSKALLDEFGWEIFEQTFRHEVAHIANLIIHNGKGHDYSFKRLCQAMGGKMNESMAGYTFKECASNDYVETIKKWLYTCPCGAKWKRAKRMSVKIRLSNSRYCNKCKTPVPQWEERILV